SGVRTLPEFMERRYGPEARTFLAVIGLLGALLIHIGISLFAAAKIFESFLGVPMLATIVVLSVFTVTYTALGGLKAVVMTGERSGRAARRWRGARHRARGPRTAECGRNGPRIV